MKSQNSFGAAGELRAGGRTYEIYRLAALEKAGIAKLSQIPYSIKILLENLLRFEDGADRQDVRHRVRRGVGYQGRRRRRSTSARRACCCRISPACPAWSIWRRCAMRCAKMGADPKKANPLIPVDLVIDHSVQVDEFGTDGRVRSQRAARISAQSGALCVPALGPDGVSEFPRGAARYRHRASGESGISGAGGLHRSNGAARIPTPWSAPIRTPR